MAIKAGVGGNFTDGLCCRMVIETKRVFDGCAFNDSNVTLTLVTEQQIPQAAAFVSAHAVSSELVDYTVSDGSNGCSRVVGEAVTRFDVTYEAGGQNYTVAAYYKENKDVLLRLPRNDSLIPYSIEVRTFMQPRNGAIIGLNAVTVRGCLLQVIKVTAPVDILVPTYGYCKYPPCTGCACPGVNPDDVFPALPDE